MYKPKIALQPKSSKNNSSSVLAISLRDAHALGKYLQRERELLTLGDTSGRKASKGAQDGAREAGPMA
jgi:hypothetical protein